MKADVVVVGAGLAGLVAAREMERAGADVLVLESLSPIDRSMLTQAVREVAAAQRRMDNIAQYVPIDAWTSPEES